MQAHLQVHTVHCGHLTEPRQREVTVPVAVVPLIATTALGLMARVDAT
jgi:hypothetical protein